MEYVYYMMTFVLLFFVYLFFLFLFYYRSLVFSYEFDYFQNLFYNIL